MNSKNSTIKKFVAGLLGGTIALSLILGFSFSPVKALTNEELTAQINSLLATIASLQAQLSSSSATPAASMASALTRDLTVGSRGDDVKTLQSWLGVSQTGYFGALTKAAVVKYQQSKGITPAVGYVGAKTRSSLNSMASASTPSTTTTTTTTTPAPAPVGTGLAVSDPGQPSVSLAPEGASRVPFTKVRLSAGNDGDVTVNSITVSRTGLAQDAVFGGIVLLDEDGIQVGVAKTLNSNHQVAVGEPFKIKAGTSKVVTIAGNMASSLDSYAGQVATLTVVGVNTSATVSGTLPITGVGQTMNASLSLGSVTTAVSSFDPNSAQSIPIGTTAYKFSGLKITAGSSEDIRLWSIRFNQSGSASSNDLANVMVNVDGTAYPTVVSADGKYYTAKFGNGMVIAKGFSKDVYVVADIVGTGAANRTVQFDIYKTTDVYMTGETYGYGITPSAGSGSSSTATTITNSTPWFDASQITINAGTVTTITKSAAVPAQNIAVNVPNQPLGGFETDIKGEPITVASMVFSIASTTGSGTGLLTNVSLVDQDGAVVAGPVDGVYVSALVQTATFTDTVTFPVGKRTYTLKGKVAAAIGNGGTYIVSTTPSSQWTTVTGASTGNSVSLSALSTAVSMNTMTIKSAALAVNVSSNPASQTIVAGGTARTFMNLQLDATQSGEDVRLSSVPLTLAASNAVTDLTGCQFFDGATALNTGSNVVNPDATTETFTFDTSLTVAKGTVKTLTLKCAVSSAGTGTYVWSMTNGQATGLTVTGVTSSNSVTSTNGAGSGTLTAGTMTIGSGTLTISTDSSSPSYQLAAAGTTGVTAGVLKLRAANEAINLQRVVLQLTNTSSSSPKDLIQVSLWDGATQVGTATFTGSNTVATSTLSTPVMIPKDTDKTLTIKADLGTINASAPLQFSGHLVAIDYYSSDGTGTYGTGVESGVTRNATGSSAVSGIRLVATYPTLAVDTLSSSGVSGGALMRFKVTASSAGPVGIAKFTVTLATSSASVTNLNIFGYSDSGYSSPISGINNNGQFLTTSACASGCVSNGPTVSIYPQTSAAATTTVQIPAGATRYFEVRGTVAAASGATNYSVTTTLGGDTAFPLYGAPNGSATTGMSFATSTVVIDATANRSFLWSPNSTTTSSVNDVDWFNGFGVLGLPSNGIIVTRTN